MTVQDYVILVDEADNMIGQAEKMAAHRTASLHRAFSIFIFRQHKQTLETLLQQRQHTKYHSPGLWTNACCSHPLPGESVLAASQRRLREELGISIPLRQVTHFIYRAGVGAGLIEHEYDHILVGSYSEAAVPYNPHEVAACKWISVDALIEDLQHNSAQYTAWFEKALHLALPHFQH